MVKNHGATVAALAIAALAVGALSAWLIGVPVAALIWLLGELAFGARLEQALLNAYFVLTWGLYFMGPSSLVLGALGGVITFKLTRWLQGSKYLTGVAVCGACLGALNGAWLDLVGTGDERLFIALGAIAGALTGTIAGLIIRRVCQTQVQHE